MERLTEWFEDRENGRIAGISFRLQEKFSVEEVVDLLAGRLAAYEDTGLEPDEVSSLVYKLSGVMHFVDKWLGEEELNKDEVLRAEAMRNKTLKLVEALQKELDHLREMAEAEKAGRLVALPFVAMIEQSLENGKFGPQRDQCFNGRYAVVYSDKKKWASPLIDICGRHYHREQAEARLVELTRKEAEAELETQKGGGQS